MQPTTLAALNPQIVADLHSLADSWKAVADELAPTAAPKKRRAPSKRKAKA